MNRLNPPRSSKPQTRASQSRGRPTRAASAGRRRQRVTVATWIALGATGLVALSAADAVETPAARAEQGRKPTAGANLVAGAIAASESSPLLAIGLLADGTDETPAPNLLEQIEQIELAESTLNDGPPARPEVQPLALDIAIGLAIDAALVEIPVIAERAEEPAPTDTGVPGESVGDPATGDSGSGDPGPLPGLPAPITGWWPSEDQWHRLRMCESTDNPRAISPQGWYRGLYQFDFRTWASVGGSGDPVDASREEQFLRALILYAQRGPSPWPVCGRFLY